MVPTSGFEVPNELENLCHQPPIDFPKEPLDAVVAFSIGASGESLRPIVVLLAEHILGLKVKGNAVDKSRSKAEKLFKQTLLNRLALRAR
ncbi:hypothetical protein SAMN05216573_1269 [Bradyrhizobium sp. Rc3b]|uniref:hypothetical protein n=1 Tax=Bradyrhizobium sp. Rc3b TaxID=1855322 RepID=UPI0008E56162|nr:hypothetical protein [Bradyrhizobium sp. Rc3b]SFN91055.1 hypothetical protein SAMN05216573_1269 [Bradyrhizobium sp. Rc3b]